MRSDEPQWRRWQRGTWAVSTVLLVLNGLVVGYGSVWFQLFGESADHADYLMSAGGYAAAAFALALGAAAGAGPQPLIGRRAAGAALAAAAPLAVLAARSWSEASSLPPENSVPNGFWDGAGGVLLLPWTWFVVATGVRGVWQAARALGDASR